MYAPTEATWPLTNSTRVPAYCSAWALPQPTPGTFASRVQPPPGAREAIPVKRGCDAVGTPFQRNSPRPPASNDRRAGPSAPGPAGTGSAVQVPATAGSAKTSSNTNVATEVRVFLRAGMVTFYAVCGARGSSARVGRSHARDLERIRKAREEAIRRNNVQIGNTAEPEAEAATPKPKKTKKAPEWKSLPDAEKAQYLLDHQTLSDRTWTNEPRLKGEKRDAFIRRILLG